MRNKITLKDFNHGVGMPQHKGAKRLVFIFPILILSFLFNYTNLYAQNGTYELSLGTPVTSNTTLKKIGITPFAKGRKDSRSQYLYLASELAGSGATTGSISSIAFNVTNLNGLPFELTNVNVYLSATSSTELIDGQNEMPANNNTPNRSLATLLISATGWVTIDLDTPYVWNGTSNIIVEICKSNTSVSAENYSVQASQGSGLMIRSRYTKVNNASVHIPGCSMTTYPATSNVSALTSATDRKIRPDIRFTFACDGTPAGGIAVNRNPNSKCFGDAVSLEVEEGEVSTGLQYQWQISTDNGITFSDIDQAIGKTMQVTQGVDKIYYRRQTKCGGYSVNSAACVVEALNKWDGTAWSRATPPLANETGVIDGDFTTQDLELCSLILISGNMIVQSGYTLTVGKQVAVYGGTLTFEDSASLIQESVSEANIGSITYKRNSQPVRRYDFTYWSSPVQDQQLLAFSPNTQFDKFYSWNHHTNNWFTEPNTNLMQASKGYIIRAPQTFSITGPGEVFTGVFIGKPNNGQITTPLTTTGQWNLIGNPYPSAVDAHAFLTNPSNESALDGTLYFWTHNTSPNSSIPGSSAFNYTSNDYATWNLTGGVGMQTSASTQGNDTAPDGFIAAGQSFMVKTLAGGVATFENEMRKGSNNGTFFRSSQVQNKSRLWLQLANSGGFKQALVGYVDGATSGLDRGYDGGAMDGSVVSFYSLLGEQTLGIQGLPLPFDTGGQVAMGYKTTLAGEQQISLFDYDGLFLNQDVYIEDTFTSVIHNLKDGVYIFKSAAGTFNNRFILRYNNPSASVADSGINTAIAYSKQKNLIINGGENTIETVTVYDLTGRLLFTQSGYNSSQFTIDGEDWETQVLIVQIITTDRSSITRKIIF